jgi:glycosyltransferase involved in cell wall biosynthesis
VKIIILTQYYPPETGAPQRRLSDLAQRFVRSGHSVTVLTAMPNYPTGKIFKEYGGLVRREEVDGVKIIRTFIYPTQSASFILRMTNYLSFVFSSLLIGLFMLPRADYLMVESPPLFLGISAFVLSRIKQARLIFNVSDIWPSGLARLNLISPMSLSYRISTKLEEFCYRSAWLVTCQTKGIMAEINERFPNITTYHLTNGIALEQFGPDKSTDTARQTLSQNSDEIVLLYAGLHGLAQALEQVIEAAALIKDQKYRFVFLGDGPTKLSIKQRAKELELRNIIFLDPCLPEQVPAFLASADIIIVSLKESYKEAVPSKLFEAMASGKPVLLIANSEACQIISEYQAGIIAQPGNATDIAERIHTLGQNPDLCRQLGNNGLHASKEHYSREQIALQFEAYLNKEKR